MNITKNHETIHEALLYLASRCDGAKKLDLQGFNGPDSSTGHKLATEVHYVGHLVTATYKWTTNMLWKYRNSQLSHLKMPDPSVFTDAPPPKIALFPMPSSKRIGILSERDNYLIAAIKALPGRRWNHEGKFWSFSAQHGEMAFKKLKPWLKGDPPQEVLDLITTAKKATSKKKQGKLALKGSWIAIYSEYNPSLINMVKDIYGRRWNSPSTGAWNVPKSKASEAVGVAQKFNLEIPDEIMTLVKEAAEQMVKLPMLSLKGEHLVLESEYDRDLVALSKTIDGARWNEPHKRMWNFPKNAALMVLERFNGKLKTIDPKIQKLAALYREPEYIPKELDAGPLYPFQAVGVDFLKKHNGGAIFDEMGLGKTLQALGFIREANAYPALIVVLASLKKQWKNETKRWINKDAVILDGQTPDKNFKPGPVTIINYEILKHWKPALEGKFKTIVGDEATHIKNSRSGRSEAFRELATECVHKIVLTGTPIFNRPNDLWHLLHVLDPIAFPYYKSFVTKYCGAYEDKWGLKLGKPTNMTDLRKITAGLCLRRKKSEVLKDLPPKRREWIELDVGEKAIKEYREFTELCAERISDTKKGRDNFPVIASMTELRKKSGILKKVAIQEWVENFNTSSSDPLLLMAHHNDVVTTLAKELKSPKLYGPTPRRERDKLVEQFQDGKHPVMVVSLTAGGFGLNLTRSHDVAIIEPHWTNSVIEQAEDRSHRIGQSHNVTIWNLNCSDLFDGFMLQMLRGKAEDIKNVENIYKPYVEEALKEITNA